MYAQVKNFATASATAPGAASQLQRRHILMVDDDDTTRAAYTRVLTDAGFEVSSAAGFKVALQVLESDRPLDLLLTDIVMPHSVNGIALSRMALMRRRHLKIVYLTGYEIPGIEEEALGPVLRKPIEDEQLISEIERVLKD